MPTASPASPRVLVVMPAWNEEESVGATVRSLRAAQPGIDVLVVDDGSSDGTAAEAARAGAIVCPLPFNLGVGGAMRAGYRYAVQHGYDVVAQVDADGQHDGAYLPELIAALDSADVVVGARFAGRGDYQVGFVRGLAMRLLAAVLSRLAGTRLTDVTSGFRVINRRALHIFATHYPAEYLGDTVESLVIALRTGCTVRQVPVEMRPRAGGRASQTPVRAAIYLARAVIALGLALVRRWPTTLEHPPKEHV
ncbi:Glycosyltransferase involved in cell wall bisynthesis [Nocardioides terrae]|uniref:Glycosyltransferase involved in cell wall bisynthesis n=1 Tax=Nocardioides terrae TaxID=574651 RepID=A0A1I1J4H0_9ACTN|nr:glycosyltransferase family 2 protein [Nocardioides terrae]SFC42912.1 Glycosyltransferase involved in cell wall bisynthesis [Nocardioides terrae]